ncbi:MAG: tetratricopeptide repeat protein, partial [Gammaproteobacteria bacterium]
MTKENTDISQLITQAKKGNLTAQLTLAGIYEEGLGEKQDLGLAARWFLKAAKQGFAKAQATMGEKYMHGHGVEQDYEQAIFWLRKAAKQNDVDGLADLAWCFQ